MTQYPLTPVENVTRTNISGGVFDTLLGTYSDDADSDGYAEFSQTDLLAAGIVGWKIRMAGYGDGPLNWRIDFLEPGGPSYFALGSFNTIPSGIVFGGDILHQVEYVKILTIADCFFGTPDNPSGYLYSLEHGLESLAAPPSGGFFQVTAEVTPNSPSVGTEFTLTAFELIPYTNAVIPPRLLYPRQQEGRRIYPPPNTQQFGRRTGSSSPL